jgi:CheY-like chemotaxis protein
MEHLRKILVLDDDTEFRNLLKYALSSQNFSVTETESAHLALSIALNEYPDMILLDLEMPVMSGTDFLELLKKNLNGKIPPIILISANERKDLPKVYPEIVRILSKPFSIQQLIDVVRSELAKSSEMSR